MKTSLSAGKQLATTLLIALSDAAASPQYSITDLGTLGGSYSHALAVNDAGRATGLAYAEVNLAPHAVLAQPGAPLLDLAGLGGSHSLGFDINNTDLVTGLAHLPGDATYQGFVAQGGEPPQPLGTLGGTRSAGLAINDAGRVTGFASTAGDTALHAFVGQAGQPLRDLGGLGGDFSQGNDINASDQITGYAALAGNAEQHAFLWQNGQMQDLGTLGGRYSEGYGINAAGQITGYATTAGDAAQHAFLWQSGQPMTDLGGLGGSFSEGRGINGSGDVVGSATTANDNARRAVLWRDRSPVDLNTLIAADAGWTLLEAHGIGDKGHIVGVGLVTSPAHQPERHGFLLTPDTTPPTIACPADVNTAGTPPATIGRASARDDLDPSPIIANNAPAPFPAGLTVVTWTARDAAGNGVSCTQNVTVGDGTPPSITPTITGLAGANGWYIGPVTVGWTVTDAESAVTSTACGSTTIGSDTGGQTVVCSATSAGGTLSRSVLVKRDTTPPVLTCPADIHAVDGQAIALAKATASDNLDPAPQLANDAPTGFPVGSTTVTWTASDQAGQRSSCSQQIVVAAADSTPPASAPNAVADLVLYKRGETRVMAAPGLLANDTDAAAHPLAALSDTAPPTRVGTLLLAGNGGFSFTPGRRATTTFGYRASNGASSSVAAVTLRPDARPLARADLCSYLRGTLSGAACSLTDTGVVRIDLIANDGDPDAALPLTGDRLGQRVVADSIKLVPRSVRGGSVTLNPDGSATIIARSRLVTFRYTVADDLGLRSRPKSVRLLVN